MNIIFEGIDGVGKTTIIDSFKQDLESKGFSCEKYNNFLIYTYTE